MTKPWHPHSKDTKIDTLIALTEKLIKGGKRGNGQKGTGKGARGDKGGYRGKGPQVDAPAPEVHPPCACCGLTNHKKADCKHREKICSVCDKQGHVWKICRHREVETGADASAPPKKKGTASDECETCIQVPWPCIKCGALSYNQQLQTGETTSCAATRAQPKEDPAPPQMRRRTRW